MIFVICLSTNNGQFCLVKDLANGETSTIQKKAFSVQPRAPEKMETLCYRVSSGYFWVGFVPYTVE